MPGKRKRNYRKEDLRDQKKRSSYRAALNRAARRMGHYGRTPAGKDLVHKGGRIAGLGSRSKNRAAGARAATRYRMRRGR